MEAGTNDRCNQCGQDLIEIDNRGERLKGCLTCNLWAAPDRNDGLGLARKTFARFTAYAMEGRKQKGAGARRPSPSLSLTIEYGDGVLGELTQI
jgi:hypothetical protein